MGTKHDDRLLTIATFARLDEADLARVLLAAQGVDAIIADVNSRIFLPYVIREVRLQVVESNARRALEILHDQANEHEFLHGNIAKVARCPRCDSSDIVYGPYARWLAVVSWLVLGLPFLLMKWRWRCRACHHEWRA